MNPVLVFSIIVAYFLVIFTISTITSRNANNQTFFLGNRKSPWFVVAFGMVGTLLSGVTFISVPGWVGSSQFTYLQLVLGYLFGYAIIAEILLPLYYKLKLTSIYSYLETRFGLFAYKTGASYFLLSRILGASLRLFLVAKVLQITMFDAWNIPFYVTVIITIVLIWLYTFKGGIKTIIYTDTLQTFFMITAVVATIIILSKQLNLDFSGVVSTIKNSDYSKVFVFDDWKTGNHFVKHFLGGIFISIGMSGLDQDIMQKNLTCKSIKEAKRNMYSFSTALLPVNIIFLALGALLFIFAAKLSITIPQETDDLFPLIATQGYLPPIIGIFFTIGIVAAAYSSADSALTALTTSFTMDILNGKNKNEKELKTTRILVHLGISFVMMFIILIAKTINDDNIIDVLFKVASYTYGPLLGLYATGLFTKWKVRDKLIPLIAVLSPITTYLIHLFFSKKLHFEFGYTLLIVNGLLTVIGLAICKQRKNTKKI